MVIRTLIFLFSIVIASSAYSQTGCELTDWMNGLPPNAERTPENSIALRDTQVFVGGSNRTVKVPPGFTITRYAEIHGARGVALSPDGVIFVTGYNGGRIYALPDHNRDGKADSIVTVYSGLTTNHGIAFVKGQLYVSSTDRLFRVVSNDGDRQAEAAELIATMDGGGNHASRTLEYDAVRDKLYISIGSTCNICDEDEEERATIIEMNPDGTSRRIFARGLRNAVGMDIDPRTGALWANSNDADNIFGGGHPMTNENPKEPIFIVCDGAHYGWPYGYGFKMRYPSGVAVDTAHFDTVRGPVGQMLAHSAPLGMHFIRGKALPSRYHGALLNSLHGSWNRQPPAPPRVMAFWSSPDGRNAVLEDLITGFQQESSPYGRWGRPVSVAEGADGALYVTDDHGGSVYRVAYTGEAGRMIDVQGPTGMINGGKATEITWTATGVNEFVVLFRQSPRDDFDTIGTTTGNTITWNIPNISVPQAAIRVESTNGLTFDETTLFAIEPAGAVGQSTPSHSGLNVVPNPTTDHLTISFKDGRKIERIELLDVRGSLVKQLRGDAATISVSDLAQGSYLVRVIAGGETHTTQVVISR